MRRRNARMDDEGDLRAMQDAVERTWWPGQRWHVGDLAWQGVTEPGDRAAVWEGRRGNAYAWGRVVGNHLDLHVDPGRPELAAEVLAWFEGKTAGPHRTVTVTEAETHLVAALEQAGFRATGDDEPFFRHCLLDLDELPDRGLPELPDGYEGATVTWPERSAARAAGYQAAWRPARVGALMVPPADLGDGESSMTAERWRAVMRNWPYRGDLDHVVLAPDGTVAATALGWLDDRNRVGLLEPVGTDPRHGRRGLATAVSLACLIRMRAVGATRAVVCPRGDAGYPVPFRLYSGLGFRPVTRTRTYQR